MGEEDTKEIVEKTLKEIEHPEIAKTLFELGMIEDIKNTLKEKVSDITVEINLKEMSQEEKAKFVKMARDEWRG